VIRRSIWLINWRLIILFITNQDGFWRWAWFGSLDIQIDEQVQRRSGTFFHDSVD
jgi:hypothetical protein